MAADLSRRLGDLSRQDVERVESLLQRVGLPNRPPDGMTPETFSRYMAVDKKAIDGAVRLVLLKSLGEAYLSENYDADRLRDTLAAFQIAA